MRGHFRGPQTPPPPGQSGERLGKIILQVLGVWGARANQSESTGVWKLCPLVYLTSGELTCFPFQSLF